MREDEDYINAVAEVEKYLQPTTCNKRTEFAYQTLYLQPQSFNWPEITFSVEFHFGISIKSQRRVNAATAIDMMRTRSS
jgi:hypothetical protein